MGPAKPTHGGLHLSATRVGTFKKCKRKWAFEYIARVAYAPSPWLAFGTLFHAHAERYFGKGLFPDLTVLERPVTSLTEDEQAARLFLTSLKHWPKYRPNYFEVEASFETAVPGGLFTGSVDLVLLPPRVVGDHKTTSDLKWAPSVGELITWEQPVCYSYNTAKRLDWKENSCRWVYTEKGTGRTQVVQTPKVSINYWEDQWLGTYVPLTTEMGELYAQQADPLELSGADDTDFCEAYGGCQFRHLCPSYKQRTSAALYEGFDDEEEMSMATSDTGTNHESDLDALLGTRPEAPEQDVGDTRTSEPDPDLDALFNPPARTNVAKAETPTPPPLVDKTPTAETNAKAEAEVAAKPKKEPKPKKLKGAVVIVAPANIAPEAADALAALRAMDTPSEPVQAQDEGPKAIPGAETKVFPAPPFTRENPAPGPLPVLEPVMAQVPTPGMVQLPQALGEGLSLLVSIYLSEPGALQGRSWVTAQTAVRELAAVYKDADLIVRAVETIIALRRVFGDTQ